MEVRGEHVIIIFPVMWVLGLMLFQVSFPLSHLTGLLPAVLRGISYCQDCFSLLEINNGLSPVGMNYIPSPLLLSTEFFETKFHSDWPQTLDFSASALEVAGAI